MQQFNNFGSFENLSAEQCALGGFLISEKAAKLAMELTVDDFTTPATKAIFQAVQRVVVRKERADLVTVDAELTAMGQTEHVRALVEYARMVPSAVMTDAYIAIVKDKSSRRRIRDIAQEALDAIHDPGVETQFSLSAARQALRDINVTKHDWMDAGELMVKTYGYIEDLSTGKIKPITTGVGLLDRLIGGFYPGELTVVGARPGVGKSAFALNIAVSAARAGHKVCVASLEMVDVQFGQRMFAKGSKVNGMKLRTGNVDKDAWIALSETLQKYSTLPMSFLFKANHIEDIVIAAQKKRDNGELDMLIVDYLQLTKTRRKIESERLRVAHISHELKQLSVDLNVPVIALAQLKRIENNTKAGPKDCVPIMSDLKESGDIEQDADGILLLHRVRENGDPGMDPRDAHAFDTYTSEGRQYVLISADKQRQGSIGRVVTIFDPATMNYRTIARDMQ